MSEECKFWWLYWMGYMRGALAALKPEDYRLDGPAALYEEALWELERLWMASEGMQQR